MYNRYIPQADGSYRRNRVQDSAPHHEPPRPSPPPAPQEPCADAPQSFRQQPNAYHETPRQDCPRRKNPTGTSVTGFFRQLLPKDFDTGDLLVVILLLLMSADSCDDQNYALLTLALYLFM